MLMHFFDTYIDPTAPREVKKVLDSTFVSEGKKVKEFEEKLAQTIGLKNPVAVNSGTSALHLSLALAGIGPGDEIILPAQTFIATGSVILQQGATPVFADIQYSTGNIDPESIAKKITKKTRAIIPVHWGGNPCDMEEILALAKKHKLIVIEDAAHALGATYNNKPIGTLSDFTCFSFQAIKHLTTGDGGAIACKDKKTAQEAIRRRWFGIDRVRDKVSVLGERKYNIKQISYKYHLNDLAAALGLANLNNFDKRLKKRRQIAKRYRQQLANVAGIHLFEEKSDRQSAHWLFGFHVQRREKFIKTLKANGIPTSVVHLGINHNSIFKSQKQGLPNQQKFNQTQIHIPIHDKLTMTQAEHIITTIKKGW